MSLHLEFDPHSWYMGFAIQDNRYEHRANETAPGKHFDNWNAYTDNGNTYRVDMLEADTLKELKEKIRDYHKRIEERDKYNRRSLGENV